MTAITLARARICVYVCLTKKRVIRYLGLLKELVGLKLAGREQRLAGRWVRDALWCGGVLVGSRGDGG